jgi:hypothetical protein
MALTAPALTAPGGIHDAPDVKTYLVKPSLFIPPVAALAIAGTWLAIQHQAITTLEQQSASLHKAIAAHSSDASAESPNAKPAAPTKAANAKDPIDWKKIAEQFTNSARILQAGGTGDMRMIVRFRERLQAMSKEELVAAYDEIAALDFPTDTREMLEAMILEPLVEKNLEFALARFLDRLDKNNGTITGGQISIQLSIRLYVQLSSAMQKWAEKDTDSVTAWFDQQIAAGKFDSKSISGNSHSRIYVEEFLLDTLLSTDPEAAGRRLAAIPEGGRYTVLEQISSRILKDEEQLAFATLVREQVSKENQARTLAQQASRYVGKKDYAKVTEFLDRIQATPAERSASVEQVAESSIQTISHQSKITREDIDTLREWVTAQAPGSTGRTTGRALADALQGSHKLEFSEAAELAVQYHDASDNDDVLYWFLRNSWSVAEKNKEQARILAGKISDAKRREERLQNLQ